MAELTERQPLLSIIVADELSRRISSGELVSGARLSPERELCVEFDVSRSTLRQALDDLEGRGLISRHQGRGTFVTGRREAADLASHFSIGEALRARGSELRSRVVSVETIEATRQLASDLDLLPGDPVVRLHRLRLADDEPLYLELTFMSLDRFPGLDHADFHNRRLYRILSDDYDCKVASAVAVLEPAILTPTESSMLGVGRNLPAMFLRRVTKDASDVPVEVSEALLRGDRARFVQHLSLSPSDATSSSMTFEPVL